MKLPRLAFILLAAWAALAAPSAPALQLALDTPPAASSLDSSAWLIESVQPLGQADDGDFLDLAVLVHPQTHTRVSCIVKSPLGLETIPQLLKKAAELRAGLPGRIMESVKERDAMLANEQIRSQNPLWRDPDLWRKACDTQHGIRVEEMQGELRDVLRRILTIQEMAAWAKEYDLADVDPLELDDTRDLFVAIRLHRKLKGVQDAYIAIDKEIILYAGTMGAGSLAAKGSKVARMAYSGLLVLEAASGGLETGQGISDILDEKYFEGGVKTAGGLLRVFGSIDNARSFAKLMQNYSTIESQLAAKNQLYKVGDYLYGVEDVFANPKLLTGKTPAQIEALLGKAPGWRVETLGKGTHEGQGLILREYTAKGTPTDRMIQWHPGGGRHGVDPYWKVSSGNTGTIRVGPQFEGDGL